MTQEAQRPLLGDAAHQSGVRRVCHLTTVHPRNDIRILLKECRTLAQAGYAVHLVVGDGLGDAVIDNIQVHDIGAKPQSRIKRMWVQPKRALKRVLALRPDIVHFHDPELLLIALFLRLSKVHIVYDSHEDIPRAIMSRDWIVPSIRGFVSAVFERFENFVAGRISAVIGATPHITKRFSSVNKRSVTINNYPLAGEMASSVVPSGNERTVCYIGNISRNRGIFEMVCALELADARLILAGPFDLGDLQNEVRMLPGWARVDYRGIVSREEVYRIMAQSRAGLLFFHPEPNHVDARPNKMFEYMSAGLPVLASDFPLWRILLEEAGTGRQADPRDPAAIASIIRETLDNPSDAKAMGDRGRQAVVTKYQWCHEERKLLRLYKDLLT